METPGDIQIPEIVPVMTLQETVLFPHAVMPLFIFEQRYRTMLSDILKSHRLLAIFKEGESDDDSGQEEVPAVVGTVGVVRAAHQNPDGTSNLALQGISRVRLVETVQETPYRLIRVTPCQDAADGETELPNLKQEILQLIDAHSHLTQGLPKEYLNFIKSIEGPSPFIDVATHSLCHDSGFKQQLLETLSLHRRFDLLHKFLSGQCRKEELFRELQGDTKDDEIDMN